MAFEEQIRKWASLDTQISEINNSTKALKQERNTIEQSILRHVESNALNNATIKLNDSRLQFVNNKINQPLTYKFLKECLKDIMDEEEADEVITYIRDKREPKTNFTIKRFFNN